MSRRIRVLVVDDSPVVRHILRNVLESDPEIEVAGTASSGREAIARAAELRPDLVTLDIEMPEMDGLSALPELRKSDATLPVIMVSTLTESGAAMTLEALGRGALDYVTKPTCMGSPAEAAAALRAQLLPKVKALSRRDRRLGIQAPAAGGAAPAPTSFATAGPGSPAHRLEAVVIGVSTGGPDALATLIQSLPSDLRVPVAIVQHMPAIFTRLLAERLAKASRLSVAEVEDGQALEPRHVYIAPGDRHFLLRRAEGGLRARLDTGAPVNSCRPSVDVLFQSAAQLCGPRACGVVLTGMGQDGVEGCRELRGSGGRILVQDEASSVVWGMPGSVVRAGLADEVLPLFAIARRIGMLACERPAAERLQPVGSGKARP